MKPNRYSQLLERIFLDRHSPGATEVTFEREDLERVASEMGVKLPKNLGDVIYSARFRTPLPASVTGTAPEGKAWMLRLAGRAKYAFQLGGTWSVQPSPNLLRTKVPNATPGIIDSHSLDDEQALLARIRYNRLVDLFTGAVCYSLQSHLRTTVKSHGQVETDEIYVGVDRRGVQFVFPVQAKGGRDKMSLVQIEQDLAMCAEKFPSLVCRPIGAQFLLGGVIAVFEFCLTDDGVRVASEKHYQLVAASEIMPDELAAYRRSSDGHPA